MLTRWFYPVCVWFGRFVWFGRVPRNMLDFNVCKKIHYTFTRIYLHVLFVLVNLVFPEICWILMCVKIYMYNQIHYKFTMFICLPVLFVLVDLVFPEICFISMMCGKIYIYSQIHYKFTIGSWLYFFYMYDWPNSLRS